MWESEIEVIGVVGSWVEPERVRMEVIIRKKLENTPTGRASEGVIARACSRDEIMPGRDCRHYF
jgi:hypothetical protein